MTTFEPVSALAGGLLIGFAAAVLLLANGRIAGISGILGGALAPAGSEPRGWRVAFLLGLPAGAGLVAALRGGLTVEVTTSVPTLIVAGLLVGVGTQLGSGCTSGHGVCGLSRGSPRSMAATFVFMLTAVVVVFATRHLVGGGS